MARVEDLLTQRPAMTPADLENRKTHEANHNAARLMVLLAEFRRVRAELVDKLQSAGAAALGYTAPHPRLGVPMNLVDHAYFVAEHDHYHLVRMTELLEEFT